MPPVAICEQQPSDEGVVGYVRSEVRGLGCALITGQLIEEEEGACVDHAGLVERAWAVASVKGLSAVAAAHGPAWLLSSATR